MVRYRVNESSPLFVIFKRVSGPVLDINEIQVPKMLIGCQNYDIYSEIVNTIEIFGNGTMETNEEKTANAKNELIEKSPKIMTAVGENNFYVKVDNPDILTYCEACGLIESSSKTDYVFGTKLARDYLSQTITDFSNLVDSGKLGVYRYSGNGKKRRNYINDDDIFLLNELNEHF